MAIIAREQSRTSELIPQDSHVGRCVLLVDIGTQSSPYGPKRQIIIGWELPDVDRHAEQGEHPEPALICRFYTLSLSEKANLRRDLEAWRGQAFTPEELAGFDLGKVVGVPALVSVVHRPSSAGEQRAVVSGITRLPKALECPTQITPTRVFDMTDPDASVLQELPAWIRQQIAHSAEWQHRLGDYEHDAGVLDT